MEPTISYAITVCNEHEELEHLLIHMKKLIRDCDELIIQMDSNNVTPEVIKVINVYCNEVSNFRFIECSFKGNFAEFKNNLNQNCNGMYIMQIDADEIPNEYLINILPIIIKNNSQIDLFLVPRVNIVKGITQEHINKWNWNVNENGWINWGPLDPNTPGGDYQTRIYRNTSQIQWVSKVHETIQGHKSHVILPKEEKFSLLHIKNIKKQEIQNQLYSTLG